jgi:hypothetical protein
LCLRVIEREGGAHDALDNDNVIQKDRHELVLVIELPEAGVSRQAEPNVIQSVIGSRMPEPHGGDELDLVVLALGLGDDAPVVRTLAEPEALEAHPLLRRGSRP